LIVAGFGRLLKNGASDRDPVLRSYWKYPLSANSWAFKTPGTADR
jgi:hypothetical protein